MPIRLRTRLGSNNSQTHAAVPLPVPGSFGSGSPGLEPNPRPLTPLLSPRPSSALAATPIVDEGSLAQAMTQLVAMFPSIDEQYLTHCLQHYDPATSADERVARVAEKIVALNHGYYPTIVPAQQTTSASSPSHVPVPAPSSSSSSSSSLSTRRSSGSGSWSLFSSATPPPPPSFTPTPINPTATKNAHLHALAQLFPATDPAHLRTLIDQHPANTLLAATDALLSTPPHRLPRRDTFASPLTRADLFKSPEYMRGARARLYNSFPRLWKSSIKAYFAENALDYVATYLVLSELPDTSPGLFDAVVNTLFKRARQADPAMYDAAVLADVDRLERALARRQARRDFAVAWDVNREEAAKEGQLVECACCLDDVPWEEAVGCLATAGDGGTGPHVVCVTCVRRGVQEYVFGQAGKVGDGELRCFAPGEGCVAGYADEDVLRAIRADPKCVVEGSANHVEDEEEAEAMPITFSRYVLMRAKAAATQAGLAVNECPFCAHFTVSDPNQPSLFHPGGAPNNNYNHFFVLRYLTLLITFASQLLTWLNPFPTLLAPPATLIRPLLAAHYGHRHAPPPPAAAAHHAHHAHHPLLDPRATLTLRCVLSMLTLHTLLTLLHMPALIMSCAHFAGLVRLARLLHHVDVAMRLHGTGGGHGHHAEGARELATTTNAADAALALPSKVHVSTCVARACGRAVCLTCRGEWVPHHRCYEEVEEQSLETAVELAMSRAIKRVCPSCYLQFTKSDGCNLMTCPQCKYIMCYVCRREIDPREKYQHFCQHFRVHGGKCRECTRCELYASEDESDVRQRAGKRALDEWLVRHPRHGMSADEVKRVRELVMK